MKQIMMTRIAKVGISNGSATVFIKLSHAIIAMEPTEEPTENTREPAMDLSQLKNHLFVFPIRLPTISANPSPKDITVMAMIPTRFRVQYLRVQANRTSTYINDPFKASDASPLLGIACDNSPSSLAANNKSMIFKSEIGATKYFTSGTSENSDQHIIYIGADKMWIVFLQSLGSKIPVLARYVMLFTKINDNDITRMPVIKSRSIKPRLELYIPPSFPVIAKIKTVA